MASRRVFGAAKPQAWTELRSPNFIVVTNANEKQARRVAHQFEMVRAVFREFFRIGGSSKDQPVIIIAARDEATLRRLLPEYWAQKGSKHPSGVYMGGPEKNYIGLRLDVSMDQSASEPYEPVYHEYVHYLTRRQTSRMPLWLVEGLAEFYGNIRIEGKRVYVGAPSTSNVMLLRQNPLLRLSTLFDVNASSPYYHEESKASIFYAESWALTHYLIVRDWREKTQKVTDFINLFGQNVAPADAARRTIGEPKELDGALSQYIGNVLFNAAHIDAPKIDENGFVAQPISEAESLAIRADFMVHDSHYAEAQEMLEEALKLDPKLAVAHEGLGFLYARQGNTGEAGKCYAEAIALDSQSYFAHYYYAVNLLNGELDDDSAAKAESSLRSAIKINPDFAPAYATLAYLLVLSSPLQVSDEAYMLVLHAIDLEPGNVHYRIQAVQVLEGLGRTEDAVRAATLAVSMAKTSQEQTEASAALSSAQQYQAYQNRVEEFKKAQASAQPSGQTAQTSPPSTEQKTEPISSEPKGSQSSSLGTGPIEVLSDTMGVDFGPYLTSWVVKSVKANWYLLIPEVARPPLVKKGKVVIEFAIQKDGKVSGLQLKASSGDAALDRAAYGSIRNSNPFPPLPPEFGGKYVAVRFSFYYNPDRADLVPKSQSSK